MRKLRDIVGRILRWGGILAGSLVLLALVLFATAFLINARDESLTPQAQALLRAAPNPYPPEDNIYLALAGFEAPSGESTLAAGQARIDHYNRELDAVERNPTDEGVRSLYMSDAARLEFEGKFDFSQPPDSYWDDVPPHRQNVQKVLGDNLELYQRYLALHRLRGYFETARPSPLAPVRFPPREVRTLFLARVVLGLRSAEADQREDALAELGDDMRLWRTVLTGSGSLVSKMVSIAYLHWDELVLADMIADPHSILPASGEADRMAPLFTLNDWDISSAYALEFRVQAAMLERLRRENLLRGTPQAPDAGQGRIHRWLDGIGNRFFKINATENLFAQQVARLMRAAAPGGSDPAVDPAEHLASLRTVYNPVGRILAAMSAAAREPYAARAWDGAAFQRLLRLSYEIRRQRIDAAAIPAFLGRHPEWSTHPADGRPFLWDARTGTIRVQTLGPLPAGRAFAVHVWRPKLNAG
jgi:hypothetical protein